MPYKDAERQKEYNRQYKIRSRERRRAYDEQNRARSAAIRRKSYRKLIREIRDGLYCTLGHVCSRCGFNDKRALHFHHVNRDGQTAREQTGLRHIAYLRHLERLAEETGRLLVLCANCHAIEHYRDQRENILPIPETRKPRALQSYARRFTEKEIKEIRKGNKEGVSQTEIANRFNVDVSAINAIVNRRSYKWVE